MVIAMKLKRFLATVLSTVVIFNTVSEPLLSYAAESTDKSKSKKEFEKMIYEDGVTFDEYANVLLDDQGLYQHYIQLTDPEKSQFLNMFGTEEQYQFKLMAKYSFVNELIQLKENPDLESVESVIAYARIYASLPTHDIKNHQELDEKVSEYFSKYHNKKLDSLKSYQEYLQSIANFDVNIILKHLDKISSMQKNEEKLQEYILKFRSYVLSIYGFDESEVGLPSEYIPEMTEEQRQGLLKEEEEFSKAEEAKRNQEVSMNTEENGSKKENADKTEDSEESKEDSKIEDTSISEETAEEEDVSISEESANKESTEDNLSNTQESENIKDQKEIQDKPTEDVVEESTEDDRLLEEDAEMVDESTVSTYAAQTRAINKVIFNNSPQLPVDNYFAPRWIQGKTKANYPYIPSGAFFVKDTTSGTVELLDKNSLSSGSSYKLKDSDKGKIKVEYTNVGSFNGKTVDMRITAMDWKNPKRIQFGDTRLGCGNSSFKEGGDQRYIRFKVEYFVGGTKNPVPGLKGHQLLNDMDWINGPELWQGALNCSSTVYMTSKDSNYLRIDRDFVTVSKKSGGSGTEDGADFIYLFNDNTHEFKWYGGFCGMSSADCPAQEFVIKYMPNGGSGSMSPTRVKVGQNTKTSFSQFTRAGYVQNGWRVFRDYDSKWATMDSAWWTGNSFEEANRIYGEGDVVSNTAPCGTVYFYANWVKKHQVSFDTQGGNIRPGLIRNGQYQLESSVSSEKVIHSQSNQMNYTPPQNAVLHGHGLNNNNSTLYIERQGDSDYFYIMNAGKTHYLKGGGSAGNVAKFERMTSSSNKSQYQWKFTSSSGGYYKITNKSSGLSIGAKNGNTSNGTQVIEANTSQTWKPVSIDTYADYPTKNKLQGFELWIPDSVPVKSGARFLGWNTDRNGYGTMYQPGANYTPDQAGGTVTLYAQWQQTAPADKHYKVRYNSNGGSGYMADSTHKVGEDSYLSRNQFYRSGYKFLGWSKNSYDARPTYYDGGQIRDLSTTDGAVVNLYAIWEKESSGGGQYTVVYMGNGNDGGYTPNSIHTIGQWKNLSTNGYYKNGYTFSGWSYNSNGNVSYRDGEYVGDLSTTPGATVYLYAQWTRVSSGSYYVHYDSNGGSGTMYNSSHKINEYSYLSRNQFTRSGYRFLGWSTNRYDARPTYYDGGQIYNLSTINGATVNLYAIWESTGPSSHTVTYKANGGIGYDQTQEVQNGQSWNTKGEIFSRNGYTLKSWNTDPYGNGTPYALNAYQYPLTSNLTLYAQWEQNQTSSGSYYVRYNSNGGSGYMSNSTFKINEYGYLSQNQFTRSGYKFLGWSTNRYDVRPTYYDMSRVYNLTTTNGATVDLYAIWESTGPSSYTVTYKANGGTGSDQYQTVNAGNSWYARGAIFSRSGYTLESWNTDPNGNGIRYGLDLYQDPLYSNLTLYAQWKSNTPSGQYTVVYLGNGADGGSTPNSIHTIGQWRYLSKNGYYRNGYIFDGWSYSTNGNVAYRDEAYVGDLSTTPGSTVKLYAQWKQVSKETYTVRYNGNGADGGYTPNSTHTIGEYSYLSKNEFYRNGYTFKGWATYSFGSVAFSDRAYVKDLTTTPGSIVDLYAVWEQNAPSAYTVTYNPNGGSGTIQKQIVESGSGWYARGTIFSRTDYTLESWNTDPNGRGVRYELDGWNSSLNSDLTLYAQWKEKAPSGQYTVVYMGNGADGGSTENSIHTIGLWRYLSYNGFYRNGYEFKGWAKDPTGQVVYADHEYVGNLTTTPGDTVYLYAIWEYNGPTSHTVTYKSNGGSGADQTQTVNVGSGWYARGKIFSRTNHTLESWNTDPNGSGKRYELDGWNSSLSSDLTLYAQWKQNTPKTYTVRYHNNGGTGLMDDSTFTVNEYGYLRENQFKRDGYTFIGWSTNQYATNPTYYDRQRIYNLSTTDGDVITLYAIWEYVAPNSYSITYKPNEGSGSDHIQEVQTGQSWYARGAIFSRTDYTLESWNTDPNGRGVRYELDGWHSSLNGNLTLYAQWKQKEKKQYKVQYVANGGSPTSNIEQTVLDGEYWMTKGNVFAKDGYTLESWNSSQTGYGVRYELSKMQDPITADLTLYAQYKPNKYTVNYHGNGETSGSTASSVHEFDKPQNLTPNGFKKDGYIFEGWTTIPPVSATYVVKYNGNGADSGHMEDSVFEVNKNEQLRKNTYSQTGYKFMGWSTDSKATVATYNDESIVSNLAGKGGTITLYAIWQRVEPTFYTITYKSNGGIGTDYVQSVQAGQSWTSNGNIFTKSGYTLKSWNTRADGLGKSYGLNVYQNPISENINLYAQWEESTPEYAITYKANGGTGVDQTQTVAKGQSWNTFDNNMFPKIGYAIESWNTEPNGYGVRYEANTYQSSITKDITLYAQWRPIRVEKVETSPLIFNPDKQPCILGISNGKYSVQANVKLSNASSQHDLFYYYSAWVDTNPNNTVPTQFTSFSAGGYGDSAFANFNKIQNYPVKSYTQYAHFGFMSLTGEKKIYCVVELPGVKSPIDTYSLINNKTRTVTISEEQSKEIGFVGDIIINDRVVSVKTSKNKSVPQETVNQLKVAINERDFVSTYDLKDFYQDEEEVVNLTNVNNGVVDMYAVWGLEEYTVTYKPNGGIGTEQVQKVQPSKGWYTKDAIFTKEGYTLESWNTDPNGNGDSYGLNSFSFLLDKDLVLYAQWKKNEAIEGYTVTYKPNGGNGNDFIEKIPFESYFTPQGPIFTREKFKQVSWNTSPTGDGEQYDFYTTYPKLTGDLVLYAQWEEESTKLPHTVTYKPNGGNGTDHVQYVDAGSGWYLRGAIFDRVDHTLESWNTRADGQGTRYELDAFVDSLNEDLVLYAQWRNNNLEEHRVTYKPNGGSGQDHIQTVPGGAGWYTRGIIFNKPGYVLTSWNTNENGTGIRYELDGFQTPLNNDLVLYAQWEKEEVYGIYFSRLPSAILSKDQTEWTSDAELTSVNENDHIVKYRVWYNTDSNNFMPSAWSNVIDDYQETGVTLDMIINNIPTQPYDQYVHFAGQTMHGDSIVDLVLLPAIYKVTYKANDANIPDQTQSVMKNESWIVKENIFTKPGYTLESWNTEPDGSGKRYELGSVQAALTGNLTLHAQWKLVPTAPTITMGDDSKTFYEGTTVTKTDLLKNISANDIIDGDITNKLKVTKIEYAAGRLIQGKHQPAYIEEWIDGMSENAVLDTWFMELDKELSPVEHRVTFEVTNNAGLKSTAVQSIYVKYNEFPTLEARDRYFTLEEAQSGIITDKLLREDAIEKGELIANDKEEGDFSNTSKITLLDFDAEEFKNFTDSGYRKLTFHVQDTYGPNGKGKETLCQITVYVMKDGEIVEPEKGKAIRFIDEKYYNLNKDCDPDTMTEAEKEKANKNGGLNVDSKWYCDPEYRALLQGTFGKTSGTRYHYTLEDLNAMRSFVDIHGPGNAQEIDALSKFADQFMTGKYKQ